MVSVFRSDDLSLSAGILLRSRGDADLHASALLNVSNPARFCISVHPKCTTWEETAWFDVGVAPCSVNVSMQDLAESFGVFLSVNEAQDAAIPTIYCGTSQGEAIREKLWNSIRSTSIPLLVNYADGEVTFLFEGKDVACRHVLPDGDYRPCISLSSYCIRLGIAMKTSKRLRANDQDEALTLKRAKVMWSERQFSDGVVVCGGREFRIHRCVLAAACSFFAKAFAGDLREAQEAKVAIEDSQPESVEALLLFLYTGHLPDGGLHLGSTLALAHRLEIPEMVVHCATLLSEGLSAQNIAARISALHPLKDDPAVQPYWTCVLGHVRASDDLFRVVVEGRKHTAPTTDCAR